MAFVINVAYDVGQEVHYITTCQGLPDNAELITVRTSTVNDVRTVTDSNGTTITYFVTENDNTVQVEEGDVFGTLTDATNELNTRLTSNPQ